MRPAAVIVVNHPGGIDNRALLPAESGLIVGRDILRFLIQVGKVLPSKDHKVFMRIEK